MSLCPIQVGTDTTLVTAQVMIEVRGKKRGNPFEQLSWVWGLWACQG